MVIAAPLFSGCSVSEEISSTRSLAVTYYQTVGKADPDSKISEAPHG
jgi:hypothetical protein